MSYRFLASLGALAILIAAPLPGQAPKAPAKPAAASKSKAIPRTPDGHPDLQGFWSTSTLTPLQRPAQFATKPTLSDAEATAYEQADLKTNNIDDPKAPLLAAAGSGSGETAVGGYNNLFIDRGNELARVDGAKRTSLIVDPPDGKVPPRVPRPAVAGGPRGGGGGGFLGSFDSVQTRPLAERCIIGFGNAAGPPMLPTLYNSNMQIVQTPDHIVILLEMVHDARIVRMNATHSPRKDVQQWFGDSIGHWEGDTLVVETVNIHAGNRFQGGSENMKVTERFTRADAGNIYYKATIDDPTAYTKPFTLEYPLRASKDAIFEYACHEGNYAMTDILGGARKQEAEAAGKK